MRTPTLIAVSLSLAAPAFAGTATATFGGTTSDSQAGRLDAKLNLYTTTTAVTLVRVEPYLASGGSSQVHYVVYEANTQGSYDLIWDSGLQTVPQSSGAFQTAPDANLSLTANTDYAIGVYIPDNPIGYYWANDGTSQQGITHTGAMYASNGNIASLPDPIDATTAGHAYYQRLILDVDPNADADEDGVTVGQGDCNDGDATVFPGATESCDGADEDCDGSVDENAASQWYPDSDGDGFGNASSSGQSSCEPIFNWVSDNTDCNDANSGVYPDATEYCDDRDNDCDGTVDEDCEELPIDTNVDTGSDTGVDTDSATDSADGGGDGDGGGCGCDSAPAGVSGLWLLGLVGLVRNRRR